MNTSAVLLMDCPDRRGLVARVSALLYKWGANILHADQHQDHELGLFFMRVEWALADAPSLLDRSLAPHPDSTTPRTSAGDFDLQGFQAEFAALAAELGMRWQLTPGTRPAKVALFCSQYLHCIADLLERWRSGELECEIATIVSNHRNAESLARFYGVPFEWTPIEPGARPVAEAHQLDLLQRLGVELVVLARYMQVLSPVFVDRFPSSIINVHHSFLPAFTGARPYHAAHARGVKLIGATSHYVTEVLDDGPIIEQDVARISHRDQVADLVARGRDLERVVLSRAVRWHLDRRILRYGNKTVVFD
jgi:formyltetrahydrofolate deformylase